MFTAAIRPDKLYDVLHDIRTPKWKLSATGETRTNSALIDEMLSNIPTKEWKKGGPFFQTGSAFRRIAAARISA